MTDTPPQAVDVVKLTSEKPMRMAAVTPERAPKPIVDGAPRPSAVAPYTAPLSFSWRAIPFENRPLADKKPPVR
jgi:hypothetical protein